METMNNFEGLSVVLTGFAKSVIAPTLDPVNIKTVYLQEWQTQVAAESGSDQLCDAILADYEQLQAQGLSDQQIGEQLLANPDYEMPCRQLIYLWYMGAWPAVNSDPSSPTGGSTSYNTLSSDSYTSGLVWKVMQAHPMGDSNYHYGYWGDTPASLNDYTGNTSTDS